MSRPTTAAMVLAAAVGVPYAVDQAGPQLSQVWSTATGANSTDAAAPTAPTPPEARLGTPLPSLEVQPPNAPSALLFQSPTPLEGMPVHSLIEVLRMDVTREWVYSRWPRKSTGLADPDLFGIRVPLVTGTRMSDLAGSLTYYFNRSGQVDRLTFRGTTADPSQIVQLITQQYELQLQPTFMAGEHIYQLKEEDRVVSELRMRPESVLWSAAPHGSYFVEMELNRPGIGRYLSRPLPTVDLPESLAAAPPPGRVPVDPSSPLGQVQSNVENANATEAELKQLEAESKAKAEEHTAAQAAPPEADPLKKSMPPRYRWPN